MNQGPAANTPSHASESGTSTDARDHAAVAILTASGAVLALMHFTAAFSPGPFNWGFHHLAFFSLWVKLSVPALMFVALLTPVQRQVNRFVERTAENLRKEKPFVRFALQFSALGVTIFYFWVGRERVFLLGDGSLLLRDIRTVSDPSQIPSVFPSSPLVGFLVTSIEGLVRARNPEESALLAFQLMSILSGALSIVICAKLSRSLAENPLLRSLAVLLLLAGGASQLFFGYVETYPLAYGAALAFASTALAHAEGRMRLIYPAIVYGVLLMLHVGMICLLPALLFLIIQRVRARQYREAALSLFALAVTLGILLMLCGYTWEIFRGLFSGERAHLMALSGTANPWQAYTMFSPLHFVDVGNLFLLLSPFAPALLIFLLFRRPAVLLGRTDADRTLAIIALCGLAFIWMTNSDLGMSRDWDLESTYVLGAILLAISALPNLLKDPEARSRMMIMMVLVTLLHSIPWIALNGTEGAIDRYKVLQDGRLWGRETLAYSYEDLGILYREQGQLDQAQQSFERSIGFDTTNPRRWVMLADVFQAQKQWSRMLHAYEMAILARTTIPAVYLKTAGMYQEKGNADKAIGILQQGLRTLPTERAIAFGLGVLEESEKKDFQSALSYYRRTIKIDSTFAEAYLRAAECCRQLGLKSEMFSMWRKLGAFSTPAPLPENIKRQLDSLSERETY